jgi:nucleoside-diphosphate-sugar epimerase
MSFFPNVFITGASGFIGAALAAKLLNTEDVHDVLFLIRSETQEDGLKRLLQILAKHGVSNDNLKLIKLEQILCGDLNAVNLWIYDPRLKSIQIVVSSAAVASFAKHPLIWLTNVDGVMDMVNGLNRVAKIKRFIQIGTAMACGANAPKLVPEGFDLGDETKHFLEYTNSKYQIERRIRKELPEFPLIVVRPSIVVGHTQLGCKPSGSIYWVFRIAAALKSFPCSLVQKIDVVPVDYVADALYLLLTKKNLKFSNYHISAGIKMSSSFEELNIGLAKAVGRKPISDYQQKSVSEILAMRENFTELFGPCSTRAIAKAIEIYGNFSQLGILFDNTRILSEGIGEPLPFANYIGVCEETSQHLLIADQMKIDFKTK